MRNEMDASAASLAAWRPRTLARRLADAGACGREGRCVRGRRALQGVTVMWRSRKLWLERCTHFTRARLEKEQEAHPDHEDAAGQHQHPTAHRQAPGTAACHPHTTSHVRRLRLLAAAARQACLFAAVSAPAALRPRAALPHRAAQLARHARRALWRLGRRAALLPHPQPRPGAPHPRVGVRVQRHAAAAPQGRRAQLARQRLHDARPHAGRRLLCAAGAPARLRRARLRLPQGAQPPLPRGAQRRRRCCAL